MDHLELRTNKVFKDEEVIRLYKSLSWSSADKPEALLNGLRNSHTLILAYLEGQLVGLGNALSDGHLVVYYPHLLVHPSYHGYGIGRKIVQKFQDIYGDFHQQILVADGGAIDFYQRCGFTQAGSTQSMWIYLGEDHAGS